MMLFKGGKLLQWVVCVIFVIGFQVRAEDYDYSFSNECLENPLKPQYNGGIMVNSEMRDGLNGWFGFGNIDVNLTVGVSKKGNKFIIASNRKEAGNGFSQKFDLVKDNHYIVSGWIQLSEGEADVAAKFKTETGKVYAAWVVARSGCWSMFKGGFVANVSGPSELHFECNNTQTEIWADSISVKAFTPEQWVSHQTKSVEKIRKTKVAIEVVDGEGKPLPNATISLFKGRPKFPLGCAINKNLLNNRAYQNWFFSRFKYTVFENEMKWYQTEPSQGREDYSDANALLRLLKGRGVAVRGHNIFWDDPNYQPSWVPKLTPKQLSAAASKRIGSLLKRYAGKVIHWDVMNENLHSSFFESRLGADASAIYYRLARQLDGKATPFLNDFNTIEHKEDGASSPSKYLRKIKQLRSQRYSGPLGIGLESHFDTPDLAYVRTALDTLSYARLPIWITELDVSPRPNQAQYLRQILNEVSAHPAVQGIILWSAWKPSGCYRMCLTDNNFRNLATGNVVDGVLKAMRHEGLVGTTAANGSFVTSLFHGEYEVQVDHPLLEKSLVHNLTVTKSTVVDSENRLYFKVSARV